MTTAATTPLVSSPRNSPAHSISNLDSTTIASEAVSSLHVPPPSLHPDSEDAVRIETERFASELSVLSAEDVSPLGMDVVVPDEFRHVQSSEGRTNEMESKWWKRWWGGLVEFWEREVSVRIGKGAWRDHLALERTFLAYLRTSLALSTTGVLTAQLFRLQHSPNPNPSLGFFVLGIPLAASFIVAGMAVLLVGAWRFWRQQRAMVRGTVHAGGWDIVAVMGFSIVICVAAGVLAILVDIEKSYGL